MAGSGAGPSRAASCGVSAELQEARSAGLTPGDAASGDQHGG